jgi:argininosuccinate lyase
VLSRRGLGGSQPVEVARMLTDGQKRVRADIEWVSAQRRRLQAAQNALDQAFARLVADAGPTP